MIALVVLGQLDRAVGVEVVDGTELAAFGAEDGLVLLDLGQVSDGQGHGVDLLHRSG